MAHLQLSLLGPFVLKEDGEPIDLNIAKLQALLAYLAMTQAATTREQLLALLWAESHPDAARKNLRNRLWQLGQLTDQALIVAEGDTLALAPTIQSDVQIFISGVTAQLAALAVDPARLRPLLDCWRGPLLDGLQLHEAPDFELWLSQQRERLGQLYLQGLEALMRDRAQHHAWTELIDLAQRGLAFDELHEPFYQQIMIGYAQQGQRVESLRQYEQLQKRLATALDLTPLPETTALRQQIAEGMPLLASASPIEIQTIPQSSPSPTDTHSVPPHAAIAMPATGDGKMGWQDGLPVRTAHPFVGRQAQIAVLTNAYHESCQGRSRVVLISGELGMGKTTLWQQWGSRIANGAVVLATRCLNTTQALPFEPMRRLLGSLRCRDEWARIATALQPIWQAELVRLAPSLQSAWLAPIAENIGANGIVAGQPNDQQRGTTTHLSPAEERGLIAEALTQFLRAFHGEPLILFVDDLHWADSATLDWLLYLTDRMADEALLLVGACRPEDMTPQVTKLITQWQRDGVLQRIDLPHFTETETTALLTALGTDETVIQYLHTQSGGNPYYLTQLSDIAVDGIPASLADLVEARLSYLDERWQPVLQAAAILEPTIHLDLLSLTSGRTEEETVDALDGLLEAAILAEQGEEYEFTHPLVATVMRDGLSSGRRRLLHRRAAEGLLARHQGQAGEIAGQLAHHFAAAGVTDRAAHFATVAGAEALRIGAANEAVAFYRQALLLEPTAERQLGIGQALLLQPGQYEAARHQMEEALLTYESMGNCQGAIKAGLHLAASYLGTQEGAEVLHWARRVLPDLETVDDPLLHASAHYLMGTAKFRNRYALHEAEAHYVTGLELVAREALEPEIALMISFEWGNLLLERGDYAAAVTKFTQAQQLANQWRSILFEVLTLNNLAYAQLLNGKLSAAQSTIQQAFVLAEQYGLQSVHYYLLSTHGEIALAAGALDSADDAFRQAMTLAEKYNNATFVANLWAHRGRVAHARGDLAAAHEQLAQAKQLVAADKSPFLQTQIDLWLTAVAIERQEQRAAATYLHDATERLAQTEYHQLQLMATQLRTQLPQGKGVPT